MTTSLLTIGGFLGAGKTTLITRTAAELARRGRRVVVVTNDQAPELVDTRLVQLAGMPVAEVAGACFCCAFRDFAAKTEELVTTHRPDVVLAEPVGSCVDIAATVLRPFAAQHGGIHVAPFTVVVDPAALRATRGDEVLDPSTTYIYRLQLAEADILLLNKCDLETAADADLAAAELDAANPQAAIHRISAATGDGVVGWLAAVLAGGTGGSRRIEVDYDTYAAGEAALGWLNATVELRGPAAGWATALPALMRALALHIGAAGGGPAAHAKILLRSGELVLAANMVAGRDSVDLRTIVAGTAGTIADLTVNARVPISPPQLRLALAGALLGLGEVRGSVKSIRSFAPGRPVPVHRIA